MSSFNKKTRSPGWKPGGHWVECMRTGRAVRVKDIRKEWTGTLVAKEEFEVRHPQEFLRGMPDNASAVGYTNPEGSPIFVPPGGRIAIAGAAIAGEAVAGVGYSSNIPLGTFNTNTL